MRFTSIYNLMNELNRTQSLHINKTYCSATSSTVIYSQFATSSCRKEQLGETYFQKESTYKIKGLHYYF